MFRKRLMVVLAPAALMGMFMTGVLVHAQTTPAAAATEDHAALAQSYRAQAADLRAQSERHRQQAKQHRGMGGKQQTAHESMAKHCERIANNLAAAAKESEELAKLHESLQNKP